MEQGADIDELEEAPYFPYLLMIVDDGSGMVLDMEIFRSFDDLDALCQAVVRFVLDAGRPTQILVADDRTQAFFRNIASQLGVKLVRRRLVTWRRRWSCSRIRRYIPTCRTKC